MERYAGPDREIRSVPSIPSLICYQDRHVWIGRQVQERGLMEHGGTFRWMKRYISSRLEIPRRVGDRQITFSRAGTDFLVRVLVYATEILAYEDEEVAFTIPVEAFEYYQEWIAAVCRDAGIRRYRLLDEASAASLGYGIRLQEDQAYLVFDFGGGTLDVSVVRLDHGATGGRRCSVLGKSGAEIGGSTIDQWLYRDLLAKNGLQPEDVLHMSGLLLGEVERAKQMLSVNDSARIVAADPRTGEVVEGEYSRSALDDLLEGNGLFETVHATINRALSEARERGYEDADISKVLLVGGSSLIPSVRRAVRQVFGSRVASYRPLDAVALGAAAFVGGVDFYDHVQHEYALRYYDRNKGDHDYITIVPAGTAYPTAEPVAQVTVSASYDDQEHLGLEIYEISRKECFPQGDGPRLNLVFDPSGGVRFQQRDEPEVLGRFWVNEKSPTFIHALPPAKRGDKRFPIQFTIDGNKRLCVAVRDVRAGKLLMKDQPLVKLT
jgi:molecular chaperone DnaK (HSP70)